MTDCLLTYLAALLADPLATAATIALLTIAHLVFGSDPGRIRYARMAISATQIGLAWGALATGIAVWVA